MTKQEYEDRIGDIAIELGELQSQRDRIEATSLKEEEKRAALDRLDRKMSVLRSEKYQIEDEYNYQKEQEKEEYNKNREERILTTNIDTYEKRHEILTKYMKEYPNTELTKDILAGKEVDMNEVMSALRDKKKEEKSTEQEENKDVVVEKTEDQNKVETEELAIDNIENDNLEAENTQIAEEVEKEVKTLMQDDGKGKQKAIRIGTAVDKLKNLVDSKAGKAALIATAGAAAIALLIINAPVALGAAGLALVGKEMHKGRKGK